MFRFEDDQGFVAKVLFGPACAATSHPYIQRGLSSVPPRSRDHRAEDGLTRFGERPERVGGVDRSVRKGDLHAPCCAEVMP